MHIRPPARGIRAAGILTAAFAATAVAAPLAQAAYPGVNGDIAIAPYSFEDGSYGLGVIGADGSGFTPFALEMDQAGDPVFSPDGGRIAFSGDAAGDGDREIYVVDRDSSDLTPLTVNDGIQDYAPTWSPDGTQLAWERQGDIWVMNADGTNQHQITFGDTDERSPAWGPNAIAFTSDKGDGNDQDIWQMGADGANQEQVSPSRSDEREPNFSADGSKLVYTRYTELPVRGDYYETSEDLVVQTVGEETADLITDDSYDDYDPAFSPDGTTIVYRKSVWVPNERSATPRGRTPQVLHLINADGTNERVLSEDVEALDPDWGPVAGAPKQDDPPKQGDDRTPVQQQPVTTTQQQQVAACSCLSRRNFTIHLPARHGRIASAQVLVNGKSVRVRNTKPRKSAQVDLRKLPKGTFSVRIKLRTASGRVLKSVRRYRTCVPRSQSTGRQ